MNVEALLSSFAILLPVAQHQTLLSSHCLLRTSLLSIPCNILDQRHAVSVQLLQQVLSSPVSVNFSIIKEKMDAGFQIFLEFDVQIVEILRNWSLNSERLEERK